MDYSNYDYDYETLTTDTTSYASSGVPAVFWVIYLAIIVLMLVSLWKVFTKAGKPGWASLIPIYNTYVLLQIVGRPWWWLLLMFIPFVNLIVSIVVYNDLSKSFGKTVGWTIGLVLLPFIFFPMLAFGSAKYGGPSVKPAA